MKHVAISSAFDKDEEHFVKAVEDLLKSHGHKVKTSKGEHGYSIISLPIEEPVEEPIEAPVEVEPVEVAQEPIPAPDEIEVVLATEDVVAEAGTMIIKNLSQTEKIPFTVVQENVSRLKVPGLTFQGQDAVFTLFGTQFKFPTEGSTPSAEVLNPQSIGAGTIIVTVNVNEDTTNYPVLLYIGASDDANASVTVGTDLASKIINVSAAPAQTTEPVGGESTNDQLSTE